MKRLLLLLTFILSTPLFSQNKNYTFSELRGMEDKNGNTHLFYREGVDINIFNPVYHFDIVSNSDSVLIDSWFGSYPWTDAIVDYDFFNSNPRKFIYGGYYSYPDNHGYLKNSDGKVLGNNLYSWGSVEKIEISKNDTNLIYASSPFAKSTDGGSNWNRIESGFNFISLDRFADNILFGINGDRVLVKSIDSGRTYSIVDTNQIWRTNEADFFYDSDSNHIYRTSYSKLINYFSVSNNKGEANTWTKKYSSTNNLYISIDDSISGTIYLADGNKILLSTDYGNTFNLYKTLDSTIVGIYKKPNSDILYAATKYDIFEITSSTIKSIKHLITALDDKGNKVPNEFILYQNYPNPFNPTTTIKYQIPKSGLVQLKVYDILGREVATLVNEYQTAGEHSVQFSAANNQPATSNNQLTSGVYFYQLKSGNYTQTKKLVLMK